MVILHIAPLSFNKSSGVSVVVPNIVSNQNKIDGINSALIISKKLDLKTLEVERKKWEFNIYDHSNFNSFDLDKLDKPFNNPDIVIFHSTYIPAHLRVSKHLLKRGIPFIVVPHGGMTKFAQQQKKIKKKLGNILFFNKLIKTSKAVQYLSKGEAQNSNFWNKDFFVVGNGVDLPNAFNTVNDYSKDSINISYIGRLDVQNKGLDCLVMAGSIAKEVLLKNKVVINIYGSNYRGGRKILQNLISDNGMENIVKLHGPVYDNEKQRVILGTDIFVLLSRSEGQPMSVLEALSYGIPCLLTPGTNLAEEVENYKCGWKVDIDPKDVAARLQLLIKDINMTDLYRVNAREFINKYYSWNSITKTTLLQYKKVIEVHHD